MKEFITSPLEQFYVLSAYDFSLVDLSCFEKISSGLLITLSKPIDFLISFTGGESPGTASESSSNIVWFYLSSFFLLHRKLSTIFLALIVFISNFLTTPIFYLSLVLGQIIWFIPNFYVNLFDFYFSWYYTYDLLAETAVEGSELSNLAWLNGNDLASSTFDTQFFILETFLSPYLTFYNATLSNLVALSTKDFSYLIISLNTSSIWLTLAFFSLTFLMLTTVFSVNLVAVNRWQTLFELFYGVILGLVKDNVGEKGLKFFPLIFTTFMLILGCNLLGMIPYSFTVTSHLIITFTTALAIFAGMNIIGILKHRKHFLSLFFPPGAPVALAPLLVIIEFVSYVFRVVSLSVRLFANLMSGHTLLKILASFSWGVVSFWGIFIIPIVIIFIVTGLEMAIAFLQAYIFAVLLCIYLHDAFNLH